MLFRPYFNSRKSNDVSNFKIIIQNGMNKDVINNEINIKFIEYYPNWFFTLSPQLRAFYCFLLRGLCQKHFCRLGVIGRTSNFFTSQFSILDLNTSFNTLFYFLEFFNFVFRKFNKCIIFHKIWDALFINL